MSALTAGGTGLVYRGPFTYRRSSAGALTLESAACEEGRLTPFGAMLHVTDHIGSVVAVVRGSDGALYEASEYDACGKRSSLTNAGTVSLPSGVTQRDRFTGKQDQGPDFAVGYTDFGARHYSPSLRRWLVPDPLSEKYYGISPYAYCAGDPVNRVDTDGKKIYDTNGNIITYDLKNGWSSNADAKFIEVATLMQKYHTGSAIINSMLSSQEKYTITFIDTPFHENSKKMGQNERTYKKDAKGDATSIVSNDITISTKAIKDRNERNV